MLTSARPIDGRPRHDMHASQYKSHDAANSSRVQAVAIANVWRSLCLMQVTVWVLRGMQAGAKVIGICRHLMLAHLAVTTEACIALHSNNACPSVQATRTAQKVQVAGGPVHAPRDTKFKNSPQNSAHTNLEDDATWDDVKDSSLENTALTVPAGVSPALPRRKAFRNHRIMPQVPGNSLQQMLAELAHVSLGEPGVVLLATARPFACMHD